MADREKEPNTEEGQRERERELHRAQLEAVRSAFAAQGEGATPGTGGRDEDDGAEYLIARVRADMRRLDRRQRNTVWVAVGFAVSVAVCAVVVVEQMLIRLDAPYSLDEVSARSVRADRIAVTQDVRILDAAGKELAVLGRERGATGARKADGPVVLALNAHDDPSRQLLRFAASKTGAGLTLEAPTGSSSVSLLSTPSGSSVEVRNGEQTERLSSDEMEALPPVGAGAKARGAMVSAAGMVPVWTPRREGSPSGDIPAVREVGHGFLVADLSAHTAADGVEVRGRMVNTTTLVHSGIAFKISLGGVSGTLTVPKISPGNSTGFQVTLPGAAGDHVAGAQIEYLGSTVAFQATSTEPVYGRQVEPK